MRVFVVWQGIVEVMAIVHKDEKWMRGKSSFDKPYYYLEQDVRKPSIDEPCHAIQAGAGKRTSSKFGHGTPYLPTYHEAI